MVFSSKSNLFLMTSDSFAQSDIFNELVILSVNDSSLLDSNWKVSLLFVVSLFSFGSSFPSDIALCIMFRLIYCSRLPFASDVSSSLRSKKAFNEEDSDTDGKRFFKEAYFYSIVYEKKYLNRFKMY